MAGLHVHGGQDHVPLSVHLIILFFFFVLLLLAWQQHDVQELCRVMFDALEQKWKQTEQVGENK